MLPRSRVLAVAGLVLMCAGGIAVFLGPPENAGARVQEVFTSFFVLLRSFGLAGILASCVVFVIWVLALLPASPLSLAAGLIYGIWAIPMVWACSLLAATAGFWIGRRLDGPKARRFRHAHPHLMGLVAEDGWTIVLLVRLSGLVPFGLQNYAFGLSGILFGPYIGASALGVLPGSVLGPGIGALGHEFLLPTGSHGSLAPLAISVLASAALLVTVALRWRGSRAR